MEFLIILFIIYSFFQWLLGDKKKQEQLKRRRQQQQQQQEQDPRFDNPRTQRQQEQQERREPQSWEEAMKELESIFSGEPVETAEGKRAREEAEYRRPEPKPISRPEPKVNENPFMDDASVSAGRNRKQSREPGIRELEKAGNNPIFQSKPRVFADEYDHIDGPGSRHASGALNLLSDPESTQKAIILKEILDRPLSRRRREMRVF